MMFGHLANMVATIPMWIMMQITRTNWMWPRRGESKMEHKRLDTSAELIEALDQAAAARVPPFQQTTDEHLKTNWRLLAKGHVVMEAPRLRDDPGHDSILDSSPRPDDRLSAPDGRESPGHLWSISR